MKNTPSVRSLRAIRLGCIFSVICSISLGTSAYAQSVWNAGNGSWFINANWIGGTPTAAIAGDINNGATVNIFGNTAQALTVNLGRNAGNSGTLEVVSNGVLGSLTVSNFLVVGNLGTGTLRISAGATVTDASGIIGAFGNSSGSVSVTGAGAIWTNTSFLTMGNGSLSVSAGGKVSAVTGSMSAADGLTTSTSITGAGSLWSNSGTLEVGNFAGTGGTSSNVLTIADNGTAQSTGQATIGKLGTINIGTGAAAGTLQVGSLIANGSLHFNHTGAVTFAAPLSGTGLVLKDAAGTTTITSAAGFTGSFTAQGGVTVLKNAFAAASFFSSAMMRFETATVNLGTSSIRTNDLGNVEYLNSTINGGFLRGAGTQTTLAGGTTTFNGVTTFNSTNLVQNGTLVCTNFTNGGTLTNTANSTLTFDGVTNTSSGTIVVNSSLAATDFTNNGVFTLNAGGTLDYGPGNLVAGGGSRTTINNGGTVFISDGVTFELNGGLLVNNGEINGNVNVNYGALAKGSGNYAGMVKVTAGGKFSPGNSPGSVRLGAATFDLGGIYEFELRDATGAPGVGFDFMDIAGALTIDAGTTTNSKFVLSLTSLDAAYAPGLASNFDVTQPYTFKLLTARGGIVGFTPGEFAIDRSGFANTDAGVFAVAQIGNDLVLTYNPVPEPAVVGLSIGGLVVLGTVRRRRSAATH
jgi:T5SS/PEP-CTERM-associated repeat protein